MKKLLKMLLVTVLVLIGVVVVGCNVRLYAAPPERDGFARVEAVLDAWDVRISVWGGTDELEARYPEGYFFAHALHGLGRANLALQGINQKTNICEAGDAYGWLDHKLGKAVFSAELDPPYGIFYQGWRNYLLAGKELAANEYGLYSELPESVTLMHLNYFSKQSEEIAAAIRRSSSPFLSAYPGQTWPVDTFPAIVSLKAHGVLVDDRYEGLIAQWLEDIEAYREPATGLLPHKIDARTGAIVDGARATSQTLILRFLAELDGELAARDYALFREQFVVSRLGVPAVLEYPKGVDGGLGDVDSGPLVTGVSLSATAVMLGTARVLGDDELADRLWQSAETIGLRIGDRYWAADALPIGNVFAAWSASSSLWIGEPPEIIVPALPSWRWQLHLMSLVFLVPIGWMLKRLVR